MVSVNKNKFTNDAIGGTPIKRKLDFCDKDVDKLNGKQKSAVKVRSCCVGLPDVASNIDSNDAKIGAQFCVNKIRRRRVARKKKTNACCFSCHN